VNENAFAFIVQARPCPTFGRPVHLRGSPHRLRPGTSPHALRIPPHDGHPALRRTASDGSRSALACFRLSLSCPFRLLPTCHSLRPARHYPRVRIQRSSFERRRDFNPPEQCAAQRTLQSGPTPRHRSCGPFGCCLLPPDWDACRRQSMPRSPGSRACSFSACSGSTTTQGRSTARAFAAAHVAFPFCPQGRRPELVLRSSIPGPPMPLSTLRSPPRGGARKTQGQDGSLLLSCRTLSFPTTCRFIPAHGQPARPHDPIR
jgi:hypothetical protein